MCTAQPLFLSLRNGDLRDDIPQDETMNGRLAGRDITYNPLLTQCMSKDEMSKTEKDLPVNLGLNARNTQFRLLSFTASN